MAALDGAAVQTFTADAKFGDVVSDLELRGWRQLPLTAAGAALRWRNLALTDFEGGEVLLNHLEGAQALSHKGSFARLVHDDSAAYYPKCFDARDEDHVAGMLLYITQVVAAQTLERLLALDACDGEENGMALACVEACHLFSSPRQSTRQLREALFQLTLWQNYFAPQFVAAYSDDGATPELADVDALWAAFFQDAPGLSKTARLGAEAALQRLASEDVQRLHAVRGTWLVKPAGGSCGDGIECRASLLGVVRAAKAAKWRVVVQKYIERPLIILGRKFDVRQWVLVTSVEPLVFFGFSECYARFAASDLADAKLQDKFAHLCNFSIQKDAPVRPGNDIPENMWTSAQLAAHLSSLGGGDVWSEIVQPQLVAITTSVLRKAAAAGLLRKRARGFEWLGLDVMLAQDFSAWLLEVNVSPDVSHSTNVTAALVPAATRDALALILDERHADVPPPLAEAHRLPGFTREPGAPPRWELWFHGDAAPLDIAAHRPTTTQQNFTMQNHVAEASWNTLHDEIQATVRKAAHTVEADSDDDEL